MDTDGFSLNGEGGARPPGCIGVWELARCHDVVPQTVYAWIKRGMPVHSCVQVRGGVRYWLDERAVEWARVRRELHMDPVAGGRRRGRPRRTQVAAAGRGVVGGRAGAMAGVGAVGMAGSEVGGGDRGCGVGSGSGVGGGGDGGDLPLVAAAIDESQRREVSAAAVTQADARTRLSLAQAEKVELEIQERRGQLLPAPDVEREWSERLRAFRRVLDACPGRAAREIVAEVLSGAAAGGGAGEAGGGAGELVEAVEMVLRREIDRALEAMRADEDDVRSAA